MTRNGRTCFPVDVAKVSEACVGSPADNFERNTESRFGGTEFSARRQTRYPEFSVLPLERKSERFEGILVLLDLKRQRRRQGNNRKDSLFRIRREESSPDPLVLHSLLRRMRIHQDKSRFILKKKISVVERSGEPKGTCAMVLPTTTKESSNM